MIRSRIRPAVLSTVALALVFTVIASAAFAQGNEQVVIREFATACRNGTVGGQFIELEATADQVFQGSMRLVARDRNGTVVLNVNNLFNLQPDGTPWPAGRSWLLGSTALPASAGVSPDRAVAARLDSVKGSIELFGGPGGASLIDRIDYGPSGSIAAPPHGYSIERQPDASRALDASPSPTNYSGASGAGSACYCPGPDCADASLSQLRIDEVALRCANGETTTQFIELRAIGAGQEFHSTARLTARDHNGAVLFDTGGLFAAQPDGAPWAAGTTWLLAAGALSHVELADASGVQPDAFLPTLDPVGGSLALYDSRFGGATLHFVNYGPASTTPAPGRGEALQRLPDDTMVLVPQQSPENHAGTRAPVTQCPCGTKAIALASGPYVYSTRAARDTSNTSEEFFSRVGYDLRAGRALASIATGSYYGCGAHLSDVYMVEGPIPGQDMNFHATLRVTGSASGSCDYYRCSSGYGQAALRWSGTEAGAQLGANADVLLSLPLSVKVGEPWHLDWILGASISSEGPYASADYASQLAFTDLPAGMSITSCSGFRYDAPTATLPSVALARADGNAVHVEWYVPEDLSATVERTEDAATWQALGAPTRVNDRLTFDDRAVTPGARYGYRLSWSDAGGAQVSDVAWIEVPAGKLALRALTSNPSRGTPLLEYTLPVEGPVRLELTDLRGRRVWTRDLGIQPAGVHRVDATAGPVLAPGIYWARLIRPGEQALLKLIVLGR